MVLKTKKLKIGQIINYKDLCKLLKEKPKTNRQLQLKDWERYFKYEKDGQKYIIKEIYKEPITKVDNRGKSYKGKYAEYIDPLLLQYLKKEKNSSNIVNTTNNKIAEGTGIVNNKYKAALENQDIYKDINLNMYCVRDTFKAIKTKIREIVKGSLDRLQKAEKIEYKNCYFVYTSTTSAQRIPTEEETKVIEDAEESTMKEMGIKEKIRIDNNPKLLKEFRIEAIRKVQRKFDYIMGYYKGFTITLLQQDIPLINSSEINDLKIKLNELVIASLSEKIEVIYSEALSAITLDQNKWTIDRADNKYIEYCNNIVDNLCNLKTQSSKILSNIQ
ncbi:MAG TPA: hypothetical protein VF941_13805 [Clostridia bacterium]